MGKPKHSHDSRGQQQGAQMQAEGEHGRVAQQAHQHEIRDHGHERGGTAGPRAVGDPRASHGSDAGLHEHKLADPARTRDGGHRLFENRLQHDQAERNSERNRAMIDVERHNHDRGQFQVPGGRDWRKGSGPADGRRAIRTGGQGGGNRSDEDRGGGSSV